MSRITINSNILSLNAQRQLTSHTSKLRGSFDRLSSGLRITKASDDAAGLAISENLKTDSRLASQAIRNVNDGISMISIISGALEAQKGILFRMAELAEQSANGTNSQDQRDALQREYSSLQEEFDRIASSTKFNDISLLRNPTPSAVSLMAGITGAEESLLSVAAANSHRFSGTTGHLVDWINNDNTFTIDDLFEVIAHNDSPDQYQGPTTERKQHKGVMYATDSYGDEVEISFLIIPPTGSTEASTPWVNLTSSKNGTRSSQTLVTDFNSVDVVTLTNQSDGSSIEVEVDLTGIELFTFDSNPDLKESAIGFSNIQSRAASLDALDTVKNRIDELSKLQGDFGAVEARLTVAANRLQVDRENFSAAASQITDVDVASESASLANTQILQQASAAILAQANQQPQIALQLLGGL